MNKDMLSVLVPSIRKDKLPIVYESIGKAYSGPWEMIVAGPYGLPDSLISKKNIQFIEDWGSPTRCQQRALISAKGHWITWASDDGKLLPGSYDIGFKKLLKRQLFGALVMGKYLEGDGDNEHMKEDDYYILSRHRASFSPYLPYYYMMLNVGIVPRLLLLKIGGWDCRFEACPMACNDLAVRLQNHAVVFLVQDELMFTFDYSPLKQGDHGPIHDAQIENDIPLFKYLYWNDKAYDRVFIDLHNWTKSPSKWVRRFGNEGDQEAKI